MSYNHLGQVIQKATLWLNDQKLKYALIGGLAVSFRTIERATKDIDFSIAVRDDLEAEEVIRSFQTIGFQPSVLLQDRTRHTISTARLLNQDFPGIYLDLLFAVSGIEFEIADSAEPIEILPGLTVQVATIASLIALKVLSSTNKKRRQDLLDLDHLIASAKDSELTLAAALVEKIEERKFNSGKNLSNRLQDLIREVRD